MATRRFEIMPVIEQETRITSSPAPPAELLPLVILEHEIPPPPPLPHVLQATTENNNNNRILTRPIGTYLRRKSYQNWQRTSTTATAVATDGTNRAIPNAATTSSLDIVLESPEKHLKTLPRSNSLSDCPRAGDTEEFDPYLTTNSTNSSSQHPMRITNKFLSEIRRKRREFHEKTKNVSIEQRIAFHRRHRPSAARLRAQDIFDVHFGFELDDDYEANDVQHNTNLAELVIKNPDLLNSDAFVYNEEAQKQIRDNIYNELNRQRSKQLHKQHRQLILGRFLLLFMTILMGVMSFTVIYVVISLYHRALNLDTKLPDNEFLPIVYDKETNVY